MKILDQNSAMVHIYIYIYIYIYIHTHTHTLLQKKLNIYRDICAHNGISFTRYIQNFTNYQSDFVLPVLYAATTWIFIENETWHMNSFDLRVLKVSSGGGT